MGEATKSTEGIDKRLEKLQEARKSLEEMEQEIAPFIKRRDFREHSTAGKWHDASEYERIDSSRDLQEVVRELRAENVS